MIREQNLNIIKKYNNLFFIIKGVLIEHNNKRYFAYYVNRKTNSVKVIDQAIRFINKNEAPQISIDTFSARSENFQNLIDKTKSYAPLKTPILIIGARGTGKDSIAYTIYRNSMFHKNPFIVIDAKYISNQKWVELLESEDSLFLNNGYCIYIKNIHLLNESSQKMFESYLVSSNLHKRNKLIFSTIKEASHSLDNNCLLYFIKNKMHALSIVVPELNQRREDIPNLISLYISEYNSLYGKQVIGLEDDAKALLQDFNWVGNIDQLKRVVQELVVLAETSYIDYDTVKNVLKDEVPHSETPRVYNINLNNTLDKITSDIIGIVLKEENYNQSRASKRLGISRSTLWRKLKENQ